MAPLDPRFTFENFVVGKSNELAHAAARRHQYAGDHRRRAALVRSGSTRCWVLQCENWYAIGNQLGLWKRQEGSKIVRPVTLLPFR